MDKNQNENIILDGKFKNNLRIDYFDYLKILCSFCVILIHVCAEYTSKYNINSYKWKISYYYNGFSRFSVPNFFMISGALFLNRDLSFKKIVNKYIKRIYIHLLLWSIIYSLINIKLKKLNIKKKIFQIIKGHYHLWYLFSTMGLYIISPFFREIAKNKTLLESFLIIYFFFIFIIPNYIYLLSYYSKDTFNLLNYIYSNLTINNLSNKNFYFILGYYLYKKKEIKYEIKIIIYILGLMGLIFTTILSYNLAILKKKKINHFNSNYLNIFFTSISIFMFFKSNFDNNKINKEKKNIFQKISKFTFGIYLIHPLIIENIINKLHFHYLRINIILLIPMINTIIFLFSLIMVIILNKIPIIGKYLI